MAANEVIFSYENSKYYRYLKEGATATWVKDSITKQDFETNFANYQKALIGYSSLKDDYNSFTYSDGKYTCASLDKTEALGGVLTDVSVTFNNSNITSIVFTSDIDGTSAQYTITNVGSTDITLPQATDGHIHDLNLVSAVAPTCETAGNVEYWECIGCHGYFSDNNGNVAIKRSETVIDALGHQWSTEWQKDGMYHWHECTADGCAILLDSQKGDYTEHDFDPETHYCECGKKDPSFPTEGLSFELNSDNASYSVTGIGTATDIDLVIPSEYEDKPVTEIEGRAFEDCTVFISVTIPDSITSIGSDAFKNCTSLTSIIIPDSVTSIGDSAFYGCASLTSIIIPDSVTSIGDSAFYGSASLTSITIPDSVTSIGVSAFMGCTSLTSVTIPNSVTSIEWYAFDDCHNIEIINYGGDLADWLVLDGLNWLTRTGKSYRKLFIDGTEIAGELVIPNGVTSIPKGAFSKCNSLTSVIIPDSVTSIDSSAFSSCYSLTSVTIPNGVTSIVASTFFNCSSLTSVTIPDSVTSIGYSAFFNCSSLTSITIPNSVTSIDSSAFSSCYSLTSIYYAGTEAEWNELEIYDTSDSFTNTTKYFYSETAPTGNGNFWHYVNDVATPW
ncbi:MAG: leucine-rich repeat domain-containing protein [Candidatus Scatosoma sp.]